jgi:D-galactose 1-dehydrogenase
MRTGCGYRISACPVTNVINIGLVGFGKIARDEHVPAIAAHEGAKLVAVASRNALADGVANYSDLSTMLANEPSIDAIVLCQPPQVRYAAARAALLAGKHVFLEKPPGASLSEVALLAKLARDNGCSLYASWHSRYAASVARLKGWCGHHNLKSIDICWKEDVRQWHPGQEWIWEHGGFGVFDPGINALSILTEVLNEGVRLIDATLSVPANRGAPIAASLVMETESGVPVNCEFDWRQTGTQIWEMRFDANGDRFIYAQGGTDDDAKDDTALGHEYRELYRRFIELVRRGECDVDLAPLQLVADAFLRGKISATEPFLF